MVYLSESANNKSNFLAKVAPLEVTFLTVTQLQIKAVHVSAHMKPQTLESYFNAQANKLTQVSET